MASTSVSREKAKVGDIRSVVDGTTNFWTKKNLGINTMTPEDLTSDETPMDIPAPKEDTATSKIQGVIQSNTDAFTKDLEARRKASETAAEESFADYTAGKLGTKGKTALTDTQYSTGRINPVTGERESVDSVQGELDDIQQQILEEQHGLNRMVEVIETKGGGLERGANSEIRNATRDSLRLQADLTIKQLGIERRFDRVKGIADRAIDLQMEEDKNKNEILKETYERNKDQFTVDEQREFETKQGDRDRELERKEKDLERKYDLVIDAQQNGAPSSVIQAMLDSEDALSALTAGGGYVGLLDRQAKLAAIHSSEMNNIIELAKLGDPEAIKKLGFDPTAVPEKVDATTKRQLEDGISASDNLIDLASQYKKLIDDYGYTNEFVGNSTLLGTLTSLRGQMVAAYKSAEQLGTLDKGVETLLNQILGETPTSGLNIIKNATGRRSNQLSSSIQSLLDTTLAQKARAQHRLGIQPNLTLEFTPEDEDEIDGILGTANSTEANGGFDPNKYLPKKK